MEEFKNALKNHCLTISELPDKGRGILATKDFSPGDVIITVDPYVFVPDNSIADHQCEDCLGISNLKKCSGCKTVYYCSTTCQKLGWTLHRLECKAFSKVSVQIRDQMTPPVRLTIRIHCRSKLENQKTIPTSAMDNYELVKAMVSHMSKIDEKKRSRYAHMAAFASSILPDMNRKEVAENFSKISLNGYTIYGTGFEHLGRGLFPTISFINHSCAPNCILVFEGRTAVVRAVQRIPKGAEVLTSYIDFAARTATRQKDLRENYFFTCTCPRCIHVGQSDDINESGILEGYRCTDNECAGLMLCDSDDNVFKCQQCGRLRSKEEIREMENEIKSLQERAFKAEQSAGSHITRQELIAMFKAVEKLQRKLFSPFHICLAQTWEKIIVNSFPLENWSEALAYCKLSIVLYERVYPGYHPVLGCQYQICGQLEMTLGEAKNAVKSLTKAVDILKITRGTSTPVMKNLISLLEKLQALESRQ